MCDRWQIGKMVGMWLFWTKLAPNLHSFLLAIGNFYFKKLFSEIKLKKWYLNIFYMPFDGFWRIEPAKFWCLKTIIRYFYDKNTRMKNYYRNVIWLTLILSSNWKFFAVYLASIFKKIFDYHDHEFRVHLTTF